MADTRRDPVADEFKAAAVNLRFFGGGALLLAEAGAAEGGSRSAAARARANSMARLSILLRLRTHTSTANQAPAASILQCTLGGGAAGGVLPIAHVVSCALCLSVVVFVETAPPLFEGGWLVIDIRDIELVCCRPPLFEGGGGGWLGGVVV
jgi:hypothetical protein